jgi:hypothetical protein
MSTLRTYSLDTPGGLTDIFVRELVRREGPLNTDWDPLRPGEWLTHQRYGGLGLLIARDEHQMTVLWSEEPKTDFGNFAMPLARRVFTPLLAPQLVSIQPMSVPQGGIFYQDYKFDAISLPPLVDTAHCTLSYKLGKLIGRSLKWVKRHTSQSKLSAPSSCSSSPTKSSTSSLVESALFKNHVKALRPNLSDADLQRLVDKWRPLTQESPDGAHGGSDE